MKIRYMKPWTDAEIEILRANYAKIGPSKCAPLFPERCERAVRKMAKSLGLRVLKLADKEHFETKFRVTPGCWIWERSLNKYGYGQFRAYGKSWTAHRFSYTQYVGPIPDGLCVCHRCDNPKCVNPDHLWVGTNQENTADRVRKGRTARNIGRVGTIQNGEANGSAKLSDDIVRAIRGDRRTYRAIAESYCISETAVSDVRARRTWRHVA